MGGRLQQQSERYARHHAERRAGGDLVFVPERLPLFARLVGGPGRDVLDLGCRTGAVTRHFVDGNRVVGMDIDRRALGRAHSELGIETVWADAEEPLPFEDASFDAVVCGELLEHTREPDAVVAECRRVLRRRGRLVASVPNAYRLKSRLLFLAGRPPEDDPTHLHMFSPDHARALLAGFANVRVWFVGGRYARVAPWLTARDIVFTGVR
jgi:SAM-dependent methyltransferase